ncbi:MAG: T9SS type A sorting domain-containing protein [Bacteroidales bacterium]
MRKIFLSFFISFLLGNTFAQTTLDTAPDFSGKDIHGVMHYLYPLLDNNKFVLLDFFTTTCGPCVTYASDIQQAYVHFGSNQGNVFFLGINYADDNNGVSFFDSVHGIEFPTISGLNGHGNTIALNTFDVQSFPTMVLIAPNRLILNQQIYPPSFHNLDSTITSSIGIYTGRNEFLPGIPGLQLKGMYPNPAAERTLLIVESGRQDMLKYELISAIGEILLSKNDIAVSVGINNVSIELSAIKPGIYFVRIYNDQNIVINNKIVVK